MSKATMIIRKCDLCDGSPATPWRLIRDGDVREVDLCAKHEGEKIKAVFAKARPRRKINADVVKPPRPGPRRLRSVG